MGIAESIQFLQSAIQTALLVSAPILIVSFVIGITVSIFQTVTSINEMTLTFIPKMLGVALSFIFFGAYMLMTLIEFTRGVIYGISDIIQ